jgi:hypothetical protein
MAVLFKPLKRDGTPFAATRSFTAPMRPFPPWPALGDGKINERQRAGGAVGQPEMQQSTRSQTQMQCLETSKTVVMVSSGWTKLYFAKPPYAHARALPRTITMRAQRPAAGHNGARRTATTQGNTR